MFISFGLANGQRMNIFDCSGHGLVDHSPQNGADHCELSRPIPSKKDQITKLDARKNRADFEQPVILQNLPRSQIILDDAPLESFGAPGQQNVAFFVHHDGVDQADVGVVRDDRDRVVDEILL